MKKSYIILTILGLLFLVAILTNPNQDRHKEAIKNRYMAYLQKAMKSEQSISKNEFEGAGESIGMVLGGAFADQLISNLVSSDNYILFSTTKITWDGKSNVVGVGFLGNVYLSSKLDDSLDETLKKNK